MTWTLKSAMGQSGDLKGDLQVVCDSAQDLLKATADLGGERLNALRQRVDDAIKNVRMQVSETQDRVMTRARQDAMAANEYVRENPWKTVGIAAGVGVLMGVLMSRRSTA